MFVELLLDHLGQKAGTRIDVSDADAKFLIDGGKARTVSGDPLAETVGRSISGAIDKITGGLQTAVDAALKEFAAAQAKSRKNRVPEIFGGGPAGDERRTFGRFLLAILKGDRKALEEMGSRFVEWDDVTVKAAMSTQTGTTGGYLVPTEFYGKLMQLVTERSLVRPRATVIPMASREMEVTALDVTTAPPSLQVRVRGSAMQ